MALQPKYQNKTANGDLFLFVKQNSQKTYLEKFINLYSKACEAIVETVSRKL